MTTFQDLPTELRLEIWRHMSLVDYPEGPINLFPPCDGQCGYTQSWDLNHLKQYFFVHELPQGLPALSDFVRNHRLSKSLMKFMLAMQASTRRETPFPITLKINQESWAANFQILGDRNFFSRGGVQYFMLCSFLSSIICRLVLFRQPQRACDLEGKFEEKVPKCIWEM